MITTKMQKLGIMNVAIVAVSPNKPNVKYCVVQKPVTVEETFTSLVEIKLHWMNTDRIIIFVEHTLTAM